MNAPTKKTEPPSTADTSSQPQGKEKLTITTILAITTAYVLAAATFVAIAGAVVYLPDYIASWLGLS